MGSTNKTAHYELPQFVANDKPSWLGDINQAMEDIDTGIYGAKSSADGAQQTANNAVAGVANAGTRMDGIQTQLDTVATQANQTATTVTQHTSSIATNSANINTINSRLGSTDISSIGDGTVTGAIEAISQGGGGGGAAGLELIATSGSNQTYATQLAYIKTYFDALSDEKKLGAKLVIYTDVVSCVQSTGKFSRTIYIGGSVYFEQYNVDDAKFYNGSTTNVTDQSSTTNSSTINLYA